jgi:hypothetical protein
VLHDNRPFRRPAAQQIPARLNTTPRLPTAELSAKPGRGRMGPDQGHAVTETRPAVERAHAWFGQTSARLAGTLRSR